MYLNQMVFKSNLSTQKMCVSNLNVLYVHAQSINVVLNQHSINNNQSINTRSTMQYSIHTHSINQSMSTINTQSINQQYSTQSTINQSIDQQNSTQSTRNRSTIQYSINTQSINQSINNTVLGKKKRTFIYLYYTY